MNKAILHGNVGKDPESRTINEKTVTKFSLATNKTFTKDGEKVTETQWHNIVLWGKVAETASKYVKKGSSLIVEGEIIYRSYENKDKVTVYITEIQGTNIHFTGSKEAKDPKDEVPQSNEKWQGKQPVKSMSKAEDLPGYIAEQQEASATDDSLPF